MKLPKDVEKRFDDTFMTNYFFTKPEELREKLKQFLAEELEKARRDEVIRIFKDAGGVYVDWNEKGSND